MEGKVESRLRSYLPYIIIIGVVYLLVSLLLFLNSTAVTYIILIGVLPLTALLCCVHYSVTKRNDFLMSLIAPICFLPAMLFYPKASGDFLRSFIYLIAYFLCGYLGLTIGDILANRKSGAPASRSGASAARREDRSAYGERRPYAEERRPRPERNAYDRDDYGESRRSRADDDYRPAPARRSAPVEEEPAAPVRRTSAAPRARRVAVESVEEPKTFEAVDPFEDRSLDQSTTGDDIDAILREIHQRHGNE